LQDVAVMTGATVISPELGRALDSASMADLGYARRVHSDKDSTIIVEGFGDRQAIQTRIAQITQQAAVASSDYDKEQLKERAARLAGGVAVIKVGAPTEPAMKERTARVDDALHATRAAIAEGIVPGGGVAYLNLQGVLATLPATLEEDGMAVTILRHALEEPARQIAANAGLDGAVVVSEIKRRQQESGNPALGFDVMRGEYGDLVAWGVLDPAMVVRAALENAVSVAGMILSTDTLIAEIPEEEADGSE
jgi:chaperonin GroEL